MAVLFLADVHQSPNTSTREHSFYVPQVQETLWWKSWILNHESWHQIWQGGPKIHCTKQDCDDDGDDNDDDGDDVGDADSDDNDDGDVVDDDVLSYL